MLPQEKCEQSFKIDKKEEIVLLERVAISVVNLIEDNFYGNLILQLWYNVYGDMLRC